MNYSLPRPPKRRQQPSSNPDTPPLAPVSVSWRVTGVLTPPRYRGRGFRGNDRQPSSGACVTRGRAPAAQRRCRKKRIRESKNPESGVPILPKPQSHLTVRCSCPKPTKSGSNPCPPPAPGGSEQRALENPSQSDRAPHPRSIPHYRSVYDLDGGSLTTTVSVTASTPLG